jgi:hypothetical protein
MSNKLKELLDRVGTWPEEAQEELLESVRAIERRHVGENNLLPEDVIALERSGEDVRLGRFAGDHDVEGVLNKYRGA